MHWTIIRNLLLCSLIFTGCVSKNAVDLVFSSKNTPDLQVSLSSGLHFTKTTSNEIQILTNSINPTTMSVNVSTNNRCADNWQPYANRLTVSIQSLSQEQFVNVKIKSADGFESSCVSFSLTMDTSPPVIPVLSLISNRALPNRSPRISPPIIVDSGSGLQKIELRMVYQDGTVVKDWTEKALDALFFSFDSAELLPEYTDLANTYTLQLRATDKVGNTTEFATLTDPFLVGPVATTPTSVEAYNDQTSVRLTLSLSKPAEVDTYVQTLAIAGSAFEGIDFFYPTIIPINVYATAGSSSLYVEVNLNPNLYPWLVASKSFQLKLLKTHNFAIENDTINVQLNEYLHDPNLINSSRLSGYIDIASLPEAVCALHESKTVDCWGDFFKNELGALGYWRPKKLAGATDVKALFSSSGPVFCFSKSDDSLWCLGNNSYSVLGTSSGSLQRTITPMRIGEGTGIHRVLKADSNGKNTCALNFSNELYCWGADSLLKPITNYTNDWTPGKIPGLVKVMDFSISDSGAICAIDEAAPSVTIVKCWGYKFDLSPVNELNYDVMITNIDLKMISLGQTLDHPSHTACMVNTDKVQCSGSNILLKRGQSMDWSFDQPFAASSVTSLTVDSTILGGGIRQIESGRRSVCLISNLNDVWCWGEANSQVLGDKSIASTPTREAVLQTQLGKVAKLTARAKAATCYIDTLKQVFCTGSNTFGERGPRSYGAYERGYFPIGNSRVKDVTVLSNSTCVLSSNNEVKCWGRNSAGQLGYHPSFPFTSYSKPQGSPVLSDVKLLQGREGTICALKFNDDFYCWGDDSFGAVGNAINYAYPAGTLIGGAASKHVGNLTLVDVNGRSFGLGGSLSFPPGGQTVTSFYTNGRSTCTILSGNIVRCWGSNERGQLGSDGYGGIVVSSNDLALPPGETALDVKVDLFNSCIVTKNSASTKTSIYCLGNLDIGIPAPGHTGISSQFRKIIEHDFSSSMQIRSLSIAHTIGCYIYNENTYCWGRNGMTPTTEVSFPTNTTAAFTQLTPIPIPELANAESIDLSYNNACASFKNGIHCWGLNIYMFIAPNLTHHSPREIYAGKNKNTRLVRVGSVFSTFYPTSRTLASPRHHCGIDSQDMLFCWGTSDFGEGVPESDLISPNYVTY